MTLRLGPALLAAAAVFALLVVSCRGERSGGPAEPAATPTPTRAAPAPTPKPTTTAPASVEAGEGDEMPGNRIAYVGPDGNVYTINPDGTGSRRLTDNDPRVGSMGGILASGSRQAAGRIVYAWPAWSPDGATLAASRIVVERDRVSASVMTIDTATGRSTNVYDNVPNAGFVATGAPHYFYWSPDGRHLSFLASTSGALEVVVLDTAEGGGPVRLAEGAPLYYTWSPDSRSLLIHNGTDLLVSRYTAEGFGMPEPLGRVGGAFFAPAVSRDGRTLAFAAQDGESGALFTLDLTTAGEASPASPTPDARRIIRVEPFTSFKWSPARDEIAVADGFDSRRALFDRLSIANGDGSGHRVVVDESLLAFFWSPNGDRIAYVTWDQDGQTFCWNYVDRDGGPPVKLIEFLPSQDFETFFSYFDQYAYSNSVWSPDGSQLVFSGTLGPPSASGRNGTTPETDKVYVIDVKPGASPLEIATSRYAVWSWN